jgi:hypothetical protein
VNNRRAWDLLPWLDVAQFRQLGAAAVVIPYMAHTTLDDPALRTISGEDRTRSFMFHGSMRRRGQGRDRIIFAVWQRRLKRLKSALPTAIRSQTITKSFWDGDKMNVSAVGARTTLIAESVRQYQRSQFCFVPAGDTPSSRRLFDALAAGCIPIIFNEAAMIERNLPFRHVIDWSQVAIFAGPLSCFKEKASVAVGWLQRLMRRSGNLESMRDCGQMAYRKWMSYTGPAIVDGILNEISTRDCGRLPPVGCLACKYAYHVWKEERFKDEGRLAMTDVRTAMETEGFDPTT